MPKVDLKTSMGGTILAHEFEGKSFREGLVVLGRVFSLHRREDRVYFFFPWPLLYQDVKPGTSATVFPWLAVETRTRILGSSC